MSDSPSPRVDARHVRQASAHDRWKVWKPTRGVVAQTVLALSTASLVWLDALSRPARGALLLILLVQLIGLSLPIGASMAASGLFGILALGSPRAAVSAAEQLPYAIVTSWTLSVIPGFIFLGTLLWRVGATSGFYRAARSWLGWLPGGLAVTTNMAGAGLSAVSGSTIGITYALGRIGVPEMLRAGYDKRLAVGAILMAGTGGHLIPPSILLVVYAGIAQVPIGPQLLAGVLPGVILTLCYSALIVALCVKNPQLGGGKSAQSRVTMGERFRSLGGIWPLPVIATVVVGGIYSGVFTATEAAAIAAVLSLIIGMLLAGARAGSKAVLEALGDTARGTAAIFFLLMGAVLLNRALSMAGTARSFALQVQALDPSPIVLIAMLVMLYLALGLFMDGLAMILITVPIVLPIIVEAGIDPIWFGVFIVFLGELAALTPPIGVLCFVLHRLLVNMGPELGTEIELRDIFTSVLWFFPVSLLFLVILVLFPESALFLAR
jgi:C4-dicarboxylate transporter, DctM subunit